MLSHKFQTLITTCIRKYLIWLDYEGNMRASHSVCSSPSLTQVDTANVCWNSVVINPAIGQLQAGRKFTLYFVERYVM
jgi:hypothetical protein